MKKLLKINTNPTYVDIAVLIARISIGSLMLVHGLPKLLAVFAEGPVQFPGVLGMSPEISLVLTVFAEVFCSILIILGLGTRLATIPLMVTMAVAVFYIHASDPFANQEMGLHYLLVYILLFLLGSGKFSLDALVAGKNSFNLESPR